ncbi:hypothetical protein HMPREF9370_1206 [Neisseria wadsworthii 9715]|uniref:Uncharacterized protein n=1 Tax=Neisseria wadsworthii 9715 TaxID=1030841 RepID=G4CQ46_9NEIS|nr:hypothetical protein HMPREF9370_1206 [Neisseria wadsworthii 9715]
MLYEHPQKYPPNPHSRQAIWRAYYTQDKTTVTAYLPHSQACLST